MTNKKQAAKSPRITAAEAKTLGLTFADLSPLIAVWVASGPGRVATYDRTKVERRAVEKAAKKAGKGQPKK
jgi:hypothetical protein